MAFKFPNKISPLFTFIVLCIATLNSRVLAHTPPYPPLPPPPPPPPVPEIGIIPFHPPWQATIPEQKCWAYLSNIPGCLVQIYGLFFSGLFKSISPACCKATTQLKNSCWPVLFPFNPIFPPLLKSYCCASNGLQLHQAPNELGNFNISKDALTGLFPPFNLMSCLPSGGSVQSCLISIYGSIFNGRVVNIGPACCTVMAKMTSDCWSKLFPYNPFLPLLNSQCKGSNGNMPLTSMALLVPMPWKWGQEVAKCWSSLSNVGGCVFEIYGALSSGKFQLLGPACCKAVVDISTDCWLKIFPMNPMFPRLLREYCTGGGGAPARPALKN